MKQIFCIYSIIFLLGSTCFCQPDISKIVEIDGKKYYEHIVSKGESAYGICNLYKIELADFFKENPEAEKGLQIYQVVLIPYTSEQNNVVVKEVDTISDLNVKKHIVISGDTYWSLSRKYGVPVETIISANNNDDSNLQIGEVLNIPIQFADTNDVIKPLVKHPKNPLEGPCDSIIIHKVLKRETLYSIAKFYNVEIDSIKAINEELGKGIRKGDHIRIKLKKIDCEELMINHFQLNDTIISSDSSNIIKSLYNVALMLPFQLEENELIQKNCPPFEKCSLNNNTIRAVNLYHGVIMAIDSLQKAGLNINLYVYDTKNDTSVVNALLLKNELKDMDLIIGPVYNKNLKIVRDFGRINNVQVICPVPFHNQALFNNPNLTKLIPSIQTQIKGLAEFSLSEHGEDNILLISNRSNKKDVNYAKDFKLSYNDGILSTNDSIKSFSLSTSSSLSSIKSSLIKDRKNILVVPSTDLSFVTNFMTKLSGVINTYNYKDYDIVIFGLEDWIFMETVDEKYKNRFSLHVVTPGYISYNNEQVVEFIRSYRQKFDIDPGKFSFIGFDAAFPSLKGLLLYGKMFQSNYPYLINKGFYLETNFQQVDPNSGYENKNVFILKYNDYNLIRVN